MAGPRSTFASFAEWDAWVLANTPTVYYRFDESSGNITDHSGNGHTGVANGTITYQVTGPLSGMTALTFDGSSGYLDNDGVTLPSSTAWTYSFWLKTTYAPNDVHMNHAIASYRQGVNDSTNFFAVLQENAGAFGSALDGCLSFMGWGHNFAGGRYGGDINDGSWHLVHCVWTAANGTDATPYDIYVDGVQVDSNDINEGVNTQYISPSVSNSGTNLYVGGADLSAGGTGVDTFWPGSVAGFAAFESIPSSPVAISAPTAAVTFAADAPTVVSGDILSIMAPTAEVIFSADAPTVEAVQILPDPTAPADYFENFSDYPLPERFFIRYQFPVGITIWKAGGTWYSVRTPNQNDIDLADTVATPDLPGGENGKYLFLGGHTYQVSGVIAAELDAAGFPTGRP